MRTVIWRVAAGVSAVIIFPSLCFAQFGAIAGVVKDSSGAVLPGVTVEAASPALILAKARPCGKRNVRPSTRTTILPAHGSSHVRTYTLVQS
jgi:hypothetical protein